MSFLPNIPQPTDQISISQGNILNNFGILGAIAGNTNPASTSINNTSGFNFINFPVNTIPPITFPAGNIGLYAGLNPTTSQNELYINKTNQATVTQIPATASILSITSAPASATAGWTYLPSGLIIQWGSGTVTVPQNFTDVDFPISFANQCLVVIATPTNSNNGVTTPLIYLNPLNYTQTKFGIACYPGTASGSPGFTYIAIGY